VNLFISKKLFMRIGILTMHRVINYGSFLQAYALKCTLEAMGHDVDFRDFAPGQPRHRGEKTTAVAAGTRLLSLPKKLLRPGLTLRKMKFRRQLNTMFEGVAWPLLRVGAVPNLDLSADAMLIGSDEVFNYTQNHVFGYVPCLFGHDIQASIIATYAASAGYATIEDARLDGIVDELAVGLSRLAHISVRDANTLRLVEATLNRPVDMVVDPTLIYDFAGKLPLLPPIKPGYVLVYAYEGRMDSPDEVMAVTNFAQRYGLRTVSAGGFQPWCDENIVVTPFELLKVFEEAAFVITDTFHGSIFAMKARRHFVTFIRVANKWGSNAHKVEFLLRQFGMESRILAEPAGLDPLLKTEPPYDVFSERLEFWQIKSMAYLRKALGPT
jgi:hypothetical protein